MTRRAGLAVVMMLAAGGLGANLRAAVSDPAIASPIEQALIEQACSTPPAIAIDADKHDECLHAKLASLRADFGRDLGRLSSGDRRRIDAACEQIRGAEGREGYLTCLASQLATLQVRLNRGRSAAAEPAAVAVASLEAPVVNIAAPAPSSSGSSPSGTWVVVGLTLATLSAAAIGLFFAVKARPRAAHVCRVCGTSVEGAGDLCASCRREAAEAIRRAAAERTERQHAHDDQERCQREQEEEERRRLAQEAEDAREQQRELARQGEEAVLRVEEEARRRDALSDQVEPPRVPHSEDDDAVFDPYRVLAVPHDANADVIRTAYNQAKSRYDLGEVEGLGDEIKQHYSLKAQEVDRAFQMLADSHGFSSAQSHDSPADRMAGVSHS
jgi:hypothetical protein